MTMIEQADNWNYIQSIICDLLLIAHNTSDKSMGHQNEYYIDRKLEFF